MSAEDRGSKSDEATTTLVGARPIKMLEAEQKRREEEAAGSAAPAAPAAPVSPRFFPEPPRTVEATGLATNTIVVTPGGTARALGPMGPTGPQG